MPRLLGLLLAALPFASGLAQGSALLTLHDRTIAAGTTVQGPVTVANGTLHVHGTIDGDAYVAGGDIVVHPGALIRGSATAIRGRVLVEGGRVTGAMRVLSAPTPAPAPAAPERRMAHAASVTVGVTAVLLLIALSALVFATPTLDTVTETLQRDVVRALLAGIAGQAAALPVLVLGVAGLALTLVGVLLIPFAIVAYVFLLAGMLALGILAVARLIGQSIGGARPATLGAQRLLTVRALTVGIALLMSPWYLTVAASRWPLAGLFTSLIALAITWVAATAGLGAVVLARGGVRRPARRPTEGPGSTGGWQTPTPITGVAAMRRPTSPKASANG